MKVEGTHYRTVWLEEQTVVMIDQVALPHRFQLVRLETHEDTARAIADMTVRGAGAIGATAAYGMAQAVLEAPERGARDYVQAAAAHIRATRPTAQNLFYAVDRVLEASRAALDANDLAEARRLAVAEAQALADEDADACHRIGEHGADLIPRGGRVSTHCNAGWLAFVDWGSALAPVYVAQRAGKRPFVWVDETRPRLQGARLTAWELTQEGIPFCLLCDGATASVMARGEVDLVIVGADRIAANGDVANKIGTYPLALAAREANVPFYVAAPSSTIDETCPHGREIPIETRGADEVLWIEGETDAGTIARVRVAPAGAQAETPAFDVTPARLIAGIITEFGVVGATREDMARVARDRDRAYRNR